VRVVVTGASGLVGGQVATALLARGHEVRGLVRRGSAPAGVTAVRGDLGRRPSLQAAFAEADTVVHCAAIYSYDVDAAELERVQVGGTRAVLEAAATVGVRRVVVTSSAVTCGSSEWPEAVDETGRPGPEFTPAYFRTKQQQEDLAFELGDQLGLEVVAACPTVVLGGPDRRLVPSNAVLARYLLDPTRSTYPGGCNVVAAPDVGLGHALLAESGTPGLRYLLGGRNLTWRDLHAVVSDLAGIPGPFLEASPQQVRATATAAGWWSRLTGSPALVSEDEARTVGRYYWYHHDRAAALGYAPRDATETVALALSWLLASSHLPRWVREGLRPTAAVYATRPLVPRSLTPPADEGATGGAPKRVKTPRPVIPPAR